MAVRPWVTPEEVKAYTDYQCVQNRSDTKLAVDISRAEQYVISRTRNTFTDDEKYPSIPESVKIAVILIVEIYANDAAGGKGEFKSESFDDYSYTLADTVSKLDNLNLEALLDEYVVAGNAGGGVFLRVRKL